jgi:serine/threonine-protein kinase
MDISNKERNFINLNGDFFGVKKKDQKNGKVLNTAVVVTGIVCLFLAVSVALMLIIYPKISEVPEIKIPDVSNKTVAEAEKVLEDLGFVVNEEAIEQSSDSIDSGKIIKTKPLADQTVKKGTTIELIVSTGVKTIILEDYKPQSSQEIIDYLKNNWITVSENIKNY